VWQQAEGGDATRNFSRCCCWPSQHSARHDATMLLHVAAVASDPGASRTCCCCGMLAAAAAAVCLLLLLRYTCTAVCLLRQVPCKGRGESPDPLAVNMAVWEIRKTLVEQPNLFILVHCTHGFNRSGGQTQWICTLACHIQPGSHTRTGLNARAVAGLAAQHTCVLQGVTQST
jgi:hypothetical protein